MAGASVLISFCLLENEFKKSYNYRSCFKIILNITVLVFGCFELLSLRNYRVRKIVEGNFFILELAQLICFIPCVRKLLPKGRNEILLRNIENDSRFFLSARRALREDSRFVLEAIRINYRVFPYVHREMREDREFVLKAVQQDGYALFYASRGLRADREVVLAAVRQCGLALLRASAQLQADREVVLAAVQQNPLALFLARDDLQEDPELVREAGL